MTINADGASKDIKLQSNGSEKVIVKSDGKVGIGTSSPAKKLDVSGEIRASSGILFGTDTASANALDDYEEGTWTPTITFVGGQSGISYNANTGFYTKIGNTVSVWFALYPSAFTSSGGDLLIAGLPFQVNSSRRAVGAVYHDRIDTGTAGLTVNAWFNQTYMKVVQHNDGTASASNNIEATHLAQNFYIEATLTYMVA